MHSRRANILAHETKEIIMRFRAFLALGFTLLFSLGLTSASAAAAARTGIPTAIDQSAVRQAAPSNTDVTVLDTACGDVRLCIWDRRDYGGSKLVFFGSDEGPWATNLTIRSAKNHFDNRAVGFYNENTGDRVRCMNPNTNLPGPFPDATRLLFIGSLGSRC
jgi:Peptidase inhibitor family I36